MKKVVVTRAQQKALSLLSRQDITRIRKNPKLVSSAHHLLIACKKIVKKIEAIPEYAGRKQRTTAHKRVIALCTKAIGMTED